MVCKHEKLVEGYYGHDCAACGELVYPYGCEPWMPDDDDYGDSDYPDDDPENACAECGRPGIDSCQCCGAPLCGMHGEIGAGFCNDCPTAEWIAEQEMANG